MLSTGRPVRWGIAGTGGIARTFTEDLLTLDEHAVVAIGSRDAGRARVFADAHGVPRAHGSYAELADDDGVDVVYVATPHTGHFAVARRCLRGGRAVLVEKPFTVSAGQTAELIELATERGLFAMEAMWMRFNPVIRRLRATVDAGAVGRVVAVQADFSLAASYDPEHRLWNPELGGGALLDLGVYPISFGSMLLGAPDLIEAVTVPAPTGVDANTAVVARYPDGGVGLYHCGLHARSPRTATITGTAGWITVDAPFHRPESFTVHRPDAEPSTETRRLDGHGYTYQAVEVARCLRAGLGQSPDMPLDETLAIARTLDALRGSRTG